MAGASLRNIIVVGGSFVGRVSVCSRGIANVTSELTIYIGNSHRAGKDHSSDSPCMFLQITPFDSLGTKVLIIPTDSLDRGPQSFPPSLHICEQKTNPLMGEELSC